MIPLRLTIHNFLSYRDAEVDFTRLQPGGGREGGAIAVLCGPNGHGKSAILDAITWALWGRSRAGRDDEAITLNAREMRVELEFEVDGDVYAVNRKRTRGSTAELHLFAIESDGDRVPITGNVMRDTKAEIARRVRFDYETFVNSVYVRQGRANEFTTKTPGERKAVLRSVLGLGRYQSYSDRSAELAKDANLRLAELGKRIGEAAERVARLPDCRADLAALESDLEAARAEHSAAAEAERQLAQAAAEHERRVNRHEECLERRSGAEADLARADGELAAASERLGELRLALTDADSVTAGYEDLRGAREAEQEQAALAARAAAVRERQAVAQQQLAAARGRLEAELAQLAAALSESDEAATALERLREAAMGLGRERTALTELAAASEAAAGIAAGLRAEAARQQSTAAALRDQAAELKERQAQLEGVATCPVCQTPLGEEAAAHVRDEYARQRKSLGDQYRAAVAAAEAAESEAAEVEARTATEKTQRQAREAALQRSEQDLRAELTRCDALVASAPKWREEADAIRERLASGGVDAEAERALADLAEEAGAIGYGAGRHAELRARVTELEPFESRFNALAVAAVEMGTIESRLAELQASGALARARLESAAAALELSRKELDEAEDVGPRWEEARARLGDLAGVIDDLNFRRGVTAKEVKDLEEAEARVGEALERQEALVGEVSVYRDLAAAFGRDGVQAMLIDQALPRMETFANDLLARMTGGRITVQLSTTKALQSGRQAETLDIRIADELGQRDYSLYSGGEAFRIDFALRIALSRLLAERSGATLPTLIIDEGFGSQDQEGLDRLMEALVAIAPDFRLVLVVTHIEEMKHRFEHRIEVVKDSERGSLVSIS